VFPVGTFRTWACGPELDNMLAAGCVREVHQVATYHLEPLFTDYVDTLWSLREYAIGMGLWAVKKWCKIMLTAVFGKFAQRSKRWVTWPDRTADEPFDQWVEAGEDETKPDDWRSIAWEVEKLTVIGEHRQSVPSITAWVNSLGRVRLWNLCEIAGRDQVFYVDTDSLWTTKQGYDRLAAAGEIHQTALGKLKVEGQYRHCEFRGIKHYVRDGWKVCAGLPPRAETDPMERIEQMSDLPLSFDLTRQQAPSGQTFLSEHRYASTYRHGVVLPTGRVQPFQIGTQNAIAGQGG
jgi:hypothetical protein